MVEEGKVWIHNKSETLVFFCENYSVEPGKLFYIWDGDENGENVSIGTMFSPWFSGAKHSD